MTSPSRRRALSVVLVLAVAGLSGAVGSSSVQAATTTQKVTYSCTAPGIGTQPLDFTLVTTVPGTVYVGRSFTPQLTVKVTIPGFVIGLAKLANVYYADATGAITMRVNGVATKGTASFPYTQLPTTAEDFPVSLPVTFPKAKPTKAGTLTYTPGPIAASLNGYDNHANKAEAEKVGTVDATCAVKTTGKVLGKVVVVKSPTTLTSAVTYAKAAKKVTATSAVTARSGVTPYGKVTSVLYRGTTKVRTVVATLAAGKATAAFTGISAKGSYKVVSTYSGSGAHKASTQTRFFTIR